MSNVAEMGVVPAIADQVAFLLNSVNSTNTWRGHEAARSKVRQAELSLGVEIKFPFEFVDLANFIGALMMEGKKEGGKREALLAHSVFCIFCKHGFSGK